MTHTLSEFAGSATGRRWRVREVAVAAAVLLLAWAVRAPHLDQSYWYDELTTVTQYVVAPWRKVLAARPGEYVPNNHVLHTILARLAVAGGLTSEAGVRLPAMTAGVLLPVALAWPLRRREPAVALAVAVAAAVHPWLMTFSTEARGYSLVLLFGVVATHLLPDGRRRVPVGYAVVLAAAIYTVPLAVLLVPAHAAAVAVRRIRPSATTGPGGPSPVRSWIVGAAAAVGIAGLLYLPGARGLRAYYRHPYPATMGYSAFLDWLPRIALAGIRLPRPPTPFDPWPVGPAYWAVPVLVVVLGTVAALRRPALRPLTVTLATATGLGLLLPLAVPSATEVRFVCWAAPLLCLSAAAVAVAIPWRPAGVAALLVLFGWQLRQDASMPPNQPIRDGLMLADRIVPAGESVAILYLGAREAAAVYGPAVEHHPMVSVPTPADFADRHPLVVAPTEADFRAVQAMSLRTTGRRPWVVIFFEPVAADRDTWADVEAHGLWSDLTEHYRLERRIDGRLTPVAVWRPTPPTAAKAVGFGW